MSLKSDHTAWLDMFQAVRRTQNDELISRNKKSLHNHCLNMRMLAGNMFASYLQEKLCKTKPGKAVPFVDFGDALKMADAIAEAGVSKCADEKWLMEKLCEIVHAK